MYRYKRLLIGLTGTDRDKATVQYAGLISRTARSERAYFAHVIRSLEIPEGIRRKYPQLLEPVDEYARDRMSATAAAHFYCHPEMRTTFDVFEGAPLMEMLRLARQKELDLILVGKTKEHHGSGMLPEKLARKAPCSVLIVPEDSEPNIRKIESVALLQRIGRDVSSVFAYFIGPNLTKEGDHGWTGRVRCGWN